MSEEALKQFNKLTEHDKREVLNLIRYKNEYKYQQLQQRIDKAIEYIKGNALHNGNGVFFDGDYNELLTILEGDVIYE